MSWLYPLSKISHWILAIATTIIIIHFSILEQLKDQNTFALHFLLLSGIASLIWDKRKQLTFQSSIVATVTGIVLLIIVYLRLLSPQGYQVHLSPFIAGFSLSILAVGFLGLRRLWKELILLIMFAILPLLNVILDILSLPTLTAKFSSLIIWMLGFDVSQQGKLIILPQGRVEVLRSCAGFDLITLMFTCAVLICLIFPATFWQRIKYLIVAPLMGFIINSFRVILLTLMVSSGQKEAFNYWHSEQGSLVFSMLAMILYGIFVWYFGLRQFTKSSIKS